MNYFQNLIGLRPAVTTILFCQEVDITPPRYCDFPEELVVDDGIKTLALGLYIYVQLARNVALLIFSNICFRSSCYYVYRQSQLFKRMHYLRLVKSLR